jgi:hypothetical protein
VELGLHLLSRIKESFNFDSTEVIVPACKRLQALRQDTVEVADDVVPEASECTEIMSVWNLNCIFCPEKKLINRVWIQ